MIKKCLIITLLLISQTYLYAKTPHIKKVDHPYLLADKSTDFLKTKIIEKAEEYLGVSYGFGNKTDIKTDCSGFTKLVFKEFGLLLPDSAALQAKYGYKVDLKDLQIGDLLFYRTYKKEPSHVAIYAGNGQIIHASYRGKKVQYDDIDKGYYKKRFMYAKRLALNEQLLSTHQN